MDLGLDEEGVLGKVVPVLDDVREICSALTATVREMDDAVSAHVVEDRVGGGVGVFCVYDDVGVERRNVREKGDGCEMGGELMQVLAVAGNHDIELSTGNIGMIPFSGG